MLHVRLTGEKTILQIIAHGELKFASTLKGCVRDGSVNLKE